MKVSFLIVKPNFSNLMDLKMHFLYRFVSNDHQNECIMAFLISKKFNIINYVFFFSGKHGVLCQTYCCWYYKISYFLRFSSVRKALLPWYHPWLWSLYEREHETLEYWLAMHQDWTWWCCEKKRFLSSYHNPCTNLHLIFGFKNLDSL